MKQLKVAIVPQQTLGDGIISLVLANNLHNNNFTIILYHSLLQSLNDWFDFEISIYPENENMEEALDSSDIVLMDVLTPFIKLKNNNQQEVLSKKYIFNAAGRMQDVFSYDHTNRLIERLGEKYRSKFEHIARGGARKIKYDRNNSMVENMTQYCEKTLKLELVNNHSGIKRPQNIQFMKYHNRVVIAPTSGLKKKNWSSKKFILLARLLKEKGYYPIFAVSIAEQTEWQQILKNEFELPEFYTIKNFAEYLYESRCLIGNDSGGGHLASLMGIPVLTLVTSPRKLNFRWRPGWGKNSVVAPNMTLKIRGKRYWSFFLSVNKVFNAFQRL